MSNLYNETAALDASAQAELVRNGEISASELVEAAIERLERLNPKLNAVIHPGLERARERARSPEHSDGRFRGVPFLMKDIGGEESGQPLHAGMRFAKEAGWKAREDAYFTRKTVEAGLVSLGRTNTPELALLPTTEPDAYGPTRNPWGLEYSAGGSSGGAAAAVAAGIVAAAHASDGGGSIRGPASMCALVGLKPTRGRNSFGPSLGERWSGFSSEFVLTRSVRDTAALLDVTSGPMPGDPYFAPVPARPFEQEVGADPGRLRVGLMRVGPRAEDLDPDAVAAVEKTARALEAHGHHVEESHPAALDDPGVVAAYVGVVTGNVARALEAWGEKVGRTVEQSDVEPLTWALAERGRATAAHELLASLEFVHRLGRRFAEWWASGLRPASDPHAGEASAPDRNRVPRPPRSRCARFFSRLRTERSRCPSISPGSQPFRFRRTGPTQGCRWEASSSLRSGAKTCCCGSPRSSRSPSAGWSADRRSSVERSPKPRIQSQADEPKLSAASDRPFRQTS